MARTQKYSEDQLLEAVIRYSEIEKKKIKATELAKWCRTNFKGLEEVRDYHFTRPVKEQELKTGKMIVRAKLCTIKIDEINRARDLTRNVNANLLLKSSNIDVFFYQPSVAQRKMIVETRVLFDELVSRNITLTRTNEALKAENKSMKINIEKVTEKIAALEKEQNLLMKQITCFKQNFDEVKRKEMMIEMGLEDQSFNSDTYKKSLRQSLDEVMDINATLKQYIKGEDNANKGTNLTEDVLAGIDF